MTQSFDAVVIGAGVNGLVAAGHLAQSGRSVCVIEARSTTGGMAGYCLENGPPLAHALYNLSPLALQSLGLDPAQEPALRGRELPTVALSEDGQHVVMRGRVAETMTGAPHADAAAAQALMARLVQYGDLLRGLAEAPPPGGTGAIWSPATLRQVLRLGRLGLRLRGMGKREMRRFLQVLLSNAADLILDGVPDGPLAGLLAADAVRGAATGPRSPGTVFNLIYRMGHGGRVMAPAGGLADTMARLADAARAQGVQIVTGQSVARILIKDDHVRGVETADGTVYAAPAVLSSAAPQTTAQIVGPEPLDIETSRRLRQIRARGTVAKVNFRLAPGAQLGDLPAPLQGARLVWAPSVEAVETAFNPSKYGEMPETPIIEALPVQTSDATRWLSAIVQFVPVDLKGGWTHAAREGVAQRVLDTLARALPGLPEQVTGTQVLTPDMIAEAVGAPGGHWHQAEMALDQLFTLRPLSGLARQDLGPRGLLLCGAGSHPGGDIMGLAGRNAALRLLERAA